MVRLQVSLLLLLASHLFITIQAQVRAPPLFNVASDKPITATSTCGEETNATPLREEYCQLTLTREAQSETCGYCDASRGNEEHRIEFAVDGGEKWWQSPPLSRGEPFHEVNITLNLLQVGNSCRCVCSCLCRCTHHQRHLRLQSPPTRRSNTFSISLFFYARLMLCLKRCSL